MKTSALKSEPRCTASGQRSLTSARRYIEYILKMRRFDTLSIPPLCFILHATSHQDRLRERLPHQAIDIGSQRPQPVDLFTPDGETPFGITVTHPGAPMAAMLLEELIALGFQRFITIGTAGHPITPQSAADQDLDVGNLVCVTEALIYEGTSSHYARGADSVQPTAEYSAAVANIVSQAGIKVTKGRCATTDAIYRETSDFIEEVVGRGAIAIDMELSALCTVANHHSVQLAAVLCISDVVGGENDWSLDQADDHLDLQQWAALECLINQTEFL